jgi:hypothetical protein
VLLAHDPHRGRAGGEILPQVARRGQRLRHRPPAELAELITEPRDDRGVRVTIDQAGHHEAIAQIERAGAGWGRRGVGAPHRGDAAVGDDDARVTERGCAGTVEQRAAPDGPHGHLSLRSAR